MGFSYPQGLFSLAFVAVLVWIYLRERRQRALDVPSLLLWRSVREDSRRSRFPVDPLFLLQALLLASLALGVAQPYLERRAAAVELRRAVLVFDTSASMQTIDGRERRFDHARRKAREIVAELPPTEEVMVIAVEARPRIVVAFTADRVTVARAIDALEPADGPGRLSLGVQLARSAGGGGGGIDILVFTD
ncbi:MAG: vWA domain-containing protein, partial [Candidatus Binatia bacterium]